MGDQDIIEGVPVGRCCCGGIMAYGQNPSKTEPEWGHIAPTEEEVAFGVHMLSADYEYILVTKEMFDGWDLPFEEIRKKLNYFLTLEDCRQ